jgi:hypothetical protein
MAVRFTNLDQFKVKLKDFETLTEQEQIKLLKKVAFQVLTGVVEKTPVDTGRARGNWQVSITAGAGNATITRLDDSGEAEAHLPPGTSSAIDAGLAVLAGVKPFSTIVIYNNVEYIVALEHGHSKRQAPQGMVAVTIAEVESQFR